MPVPGVEAHIDDFSRRLDAWLRHTISTAHGSEAFDLAFVSHFTTAPAQAAAPASGTEAPDAAAARPRIEVCFQAITAEKPDRASLNRDETFLLTYLLRVTAADAFASQRIYSAIYFAAHESADFDIASPPRQGARAILPALDGGPATLALTARLVRRERASAPGIVTHPLEVRMRPLGRITGRVVTRAGVPVMRAEIDARSLDKRVLSDAAGRFTISGAPAKGTLSLTVRARDRSVDVSVDAEKQAEVLVVIPEETEHG
ncbi:MAG TPA: carboxypeptidase-like regulatory domain-containing protein [Gammaproteobacteria bacterium]